MTYSRDEYPALYGELEEHKYFTGHDCKIKDYQGEQQDLKGTSAGEGDTQSE